MNSRNSWAWLLIGAVLFAFIYFHERHAHPPTGPAPILANLKPSEVTAVQVRPSGPVQLEIRAERTNHAWRLSQPLAYPADPEKIEALLKTLSQLTPAAFITPAELRTRPKADEDFGFASPEAYVVLSQAGSRVSLNLGSKTAPGDQLFLQVVGIEGVYVVSADLLKLIPRNANDWRDTSLLEAPAESYARLAVTNNAKGFTFLAQRKGGDGLWRLVWPFTWGARADNARLDHGLAQLNGLRVRQFVSDDPKASLDAFGLAPAQLELTLGQGSSNALFLQFGKSPTNEPSLVYARRGGQNTIFTVPKEPLAPWQREGINDFRDPHLVTVTEPVERIRAKGKEPFVCERGTNGQWHILPEGIVADTEAVEDFLSALTNAPIVQFVKDVVNPPQLPEYGLAPALREYTLETTRTNNSGMCSNAVLATLQFGLGTNQPARVFARRTDESSVYAISTNDFARFPADGWQLRERQFWDFSSTNVIRLEIRQKGKIRQVLHNGAYHWSLAPGSFGVINDLAIEDTVRWLSHAAVARWIDRGESGLARGGFKERNFTIVLELKDGQKKTLQFGHPCGSGGVAIALTLDDQPWIGELPASLYEQILYCLTIP